MKIVRDYLKAEFSSVDKAVDASLQPLAYSYEGQLEKFSEQIEKLQQCLSKLVDYLVDSKTVTTQQLEDLLGYGFTVEDE